MQSWARMAAGPPIEPRQNPASNHQPVHIQAGTRKVDIRLPGKGHPNSHGARPVHQIISMIKWIRIVNT